MNMDRDSEMTVDWAAIREEAVAHLQALLRINTTNPPGNELAAAEYLAGVLAREGYQPVVLQSAPGRGNIVARYRGQGESKPLLLLSHLDVVPAEAERWLYDPFSGVVAEGCIWGRGALDMKDAVVMQLMTMLLLKRLGLPLERDVIFAATADEEAGGLFGAGFLVDQHLDLIQAEYALTEFGGLPINLGKGRVYLCQVAEKGVCWVRMTARGSPGHASRPHQDNAVVKLSQAVARLGKTPLPFHRTAAASDMINGIGSALGGLAQLGLRLLLYPATSEWVRRHLLGDPSLAETIFAILHNTVCPTVFRAGGKTNVIPSQAEAELDGRLLPGQTVESFLAELRAIAGPDFEFQPILVSPALETSSQTHLFQCLAEVLIRNDPGAKVAPMMLIGATDAKHLANAGIPCYGFTPVQLPKEIDFVSLVHGHDERIPIEALLFGVKTLYQATVAFCGQAQPEKIARRT
ncbi:MAG: M20/M25/M40 family metallo-hydrolase [Coprothermobacterota bacterium]|nr:M20/M25/M40 family metallo-hydrolase [Coprothermobacterota bacterium]